MPDLPRVIVNPLPLPDYPLGRYCAGGYTYGWLQGVERDFRETADPTVLYLEDEDRYVLYSSAAMAWTSDDHGATWQKHDVTPSDIGYAPTVVLHRGRYWLTACHASLWVADDPLGPFEEVGVIRNADGSELEPAEAFYDPMLFADDDGRLFVYWGLAADGIKGVELDPEDPTRAISPRAVMFAYDPDHAWERFGEHNEDPTQSYVEGPWMLKHGGRYFLTYTAPGTEFASYGMGTYVGDGPLGPFRYQDHNPIAESRHGLIRGAGHGSVVRGHGGRLWCFYTCGAQVTHNFERRVGMAPAGVDADGQLRVGPVTERPIPAGGGDPVLLPVNRAKPVRPSSVAPGREPIYAVDGDLRTWWQPADDDATPTLVTRFNGRFRVGVARVAWTEPGLDFAAGAVPRPLAFTLEVRDGEDAAWTTVADNRGPEAGEFLIDARVFEPVVATEARLVLHEPAPFPVGVADLCFFGESAAR